MNQSAILDTWLYSILWLVCNIFFVTYHISHLWFQPSHCSKPVSSPPPLLLSRANLEFCLISWIALLSCISCLCSGQQDYIPITIQNCCRQRTKLPNIRYKTASLKSAFHLLQRLLDSNKNIFFSRILFHIDPLVISLTFLRLFTSGMKHSASLRITSILLIFRYRLIFLFNPVFGSFFLTAKGLELYNMLSTWYSKRWYIFQIKYTVYLLYIIASYIMYFKIIFGFEFYLSTMLLIDQARQ